MNRKKKSFSIPKINLKFKEDEVNQKLDEDLTSEMKQITSSRSQENPEDKESEKREFFTTYEADRETETTSNEAVMDKNIVKKGREAQNQLSIQNVARSCSCCVYMLAISMVFLFSALVNLPVIGHKINNLSYSQMFVLCAGLSIGLVNLMPQSRLDKFKENQRGVGSSKISRFESDAEKDDKKEVSIDVK